MASSEDWLSGLYFFRIPDLRDEVRVQITEANAWPVYVAILSLLHDKARRGPHKAEAAAGSLVGVGFKGVARASGLHPDTVRANVKKLAALGLIAISKGKPTPGRTAPSVFTMAVSAEQMRAVRVEKTDPERKSQGRKIRPRKPDSGYKNSTPSKEGISLKGNTTTEQPSGSALGGSPQAEKKSLTRNERLAAHKAKLASEREERLRLKGQRSA